VEGVKSFSRTLTNASGVRVRQGSGQLNMKATTHGQRFPLLWGIPLQSGWWTSSQAQGGLVHNINSASELRAIDKHLAGVEDKNKAITARFDIGVVLPFFRERDGLTG